MSKAWFWILLTSLRVILAPNCPQKIYFRCYKICCLCLSSTVAQSCQENAYILPLGTAHIEETFFKVILCIDTLRSEVEDEVVPPSFCCGKGLEPDRNGIRKLLGQQVPRGKIFKLPVLDALPLIIRATSGPPALLCRSTGQILPSLSHLPQGMGCWREGVGWKEWSLSKECCSSVHRIRFGQGP